MATYKRLGELLIAAKTITEAQLQQALARQKETKERLGTALINSGIITEDDLIAALQKQLGIEYVDLSKVSIPTHLAQMLPKSIAQQYQVVPVKVVNDELYLAMSDPMNFYAVEEVRRAVRKRVVQMVATASAIDHAIMILYGNEGAARAIEEMRREAGSSSSGETITGDNTFAANQLDNDNDSAPTVRLVNSILERAITERCSDIHMEPRENDLRVRMRIDGVMREILIVPKELQSSVISRLKVMSGMNISERRIPQDGRFNVRVRNKDIDLRVSTLPTVYGEKIVMRLLDKAGTKLSKEVIGLVGSDLEKYEHMLRCRSGVLLIAGPTGSGKSTTMYTMIDDLNTPDVNLVTLEDPVEYNVAGINQVPINEKTGMTFASGLRSILRQDPDIIAVGEIRDGETAEIAMRAAITGHVVLSTIHTNDAVGTIERLNDIGVEPFLTSSALRGVISQRLVRRVCTRCRKPYTPSEEEIEMLGGDIPAGAQFYRGEGCPECSNRGYKGRIAVFEMLLLTRSIRALVSAGAKREVIEEQLKKENFVTLHENAVRLVLEGTTSVDEVVRVIAQDD
ncbi:MAG: Flp pilus assembly complex ATPase component TadA [Oscillospiraceae bacterium]|nr:Flp pilus assembly complex ATPase component TadA [Oscillospiraceae bacterium]